MSHLTALERSVSRIPWARLPRAHGLATAALAEWLYGDYFIGWKPSAQPRTEYSGSPWFVAELNARCAGATTFESGFRLMQRVSGGTFVQNGVIQLWLPKLSALRPRSARVGSEVAVELPCAREGALPGFFTIVSRAGHPDSTEPHLKFYVNATPEGALALMEGLLHDRRLRSASFGAKVTNDPAHFGRRDTLLIYAAPKHSQRIAAHLVDFATSTPRALLEETPPMTVELARGISIAESPPHHEESYGAHRTRLIAEALFTARLERRPMHDALSERFEREGLDWGAPWFGVLPRGWTHLMKK